MNAPDQHPGPRTTTLLPRITLDRRDALRLLAGAGLATLAALGGLAPLGHVQAAPLDAAPSTTTVTPRFQPRAVRRQRLTGAGQQRVSLRHAGRRRHPLSATRTLARQPRHYHPRHRFQR